MTLLEGNEKVFLPAVAIAVFFFCLPGVSHGETGTLQKRASEHIEKADKLGEDFQQLGPWSRQESRDSGFYGIPQPDNYQSTPGRNMPEAEFGPDITHYPLCYNSVTDEYQYCYPRESAYYRSGFRSPGFRSGLRGRVCPPGYYFMPAKGCYRN
ncbi:MAG: hypothetical protein HZB31_10900 [Nitrospirae bacterium]|nr:hypothetical protein [Nitrospirota bacterium]